MSGKEEVATQKLDPVLWLIVVGIVIGGVYANTMFVGVNVLVKAVAGIALAAVAIGVALQTEKRESRLGSGKRSQGRSQKGDLANNTRKPRKQR